MSEEPELPLEFSQVANAIHDAPQSFATGNDDLREAALKAAKFTFDLSLGSEEASISHITTLLASLSPSEAPQTRSQTNGKRKRGSDSSETHTKKPLATLDRTPLTSLFVEDMDDDQIWAQLDLRAQSLCKVLEVILEEEAAVSMDEEDGDEEESEEEAGSGTDGIEGMDEFMGMDDDIDSEEGHDEEDDDDDEEDIEEGEDDEESEEGDEVVEDTVSLRDPSDDDEDDGGANARPLKRSQKSKRDGHPELDDGFFDLAAFNAQTEAAEARRSSKGRLKRVRDDGEGTDSDSEASVDLFATVDNDVDLDEDEDGEGPTGEAMYHDFFAPPRNSKGKPKSSPSSSKSSKVRFHEQVRVKQIKPNGKNLPVSTMYAPDDEDDGEGYGDVDDDEGFEDGFGESMELDEEDEDDDDDDDDDNTEDDHIVEDENSSEEENSEDDSELDADTRQRETIERLKDDLFAEDDESEEENLTAHEKRQAALREQIAALEAENVAKKDWVLMGEATSKSRPQNSLLEEDLEFERIMKATPVITEEVVAALEDRIKARILEGQFDDVVRIRPLEDKPFLPSRLVELNDQKSAQSLAQIYEGEYLQAQGSAPADDRDGKLKKEHDEIEKLWESISSKLDALCNAHFVPKQPKATISTVSNVASASLESALPTSQSAATMLAPEEIFTSNPGSARSRSELTPAEKRALHNKQKKAKKKMRDTLEKSVDKFAQNKRAQRLGDVKKQKQAALNSVVKSGKGITVVGKAGNNSKKDKNSKG